MEGHDVSKDNNCPNTNVFNRLVGSANETIIRIDGTETKSLIDSGSMISTIAESFYNLLPNKPILHSINDFHLEVKSANGSICPYLGYIESTIESYSISCEPINTLLLVVPTTEYHHRVPVLLGTNVIRVIKDHSTATDSVPDVWKAAFMSVESVSVGTVMSTHPITLKPMETRTVSGFVRMIRNVDAAVTEPVEDTYLQKALVCPRVVELSNPGKTARVPVRISNMSAKIMKIPAKSELCQLIEVKVLRNADLCTPHTEYNQEEPLVSNQQTTTCTNEDTPVVNLPGTSGIPTSPPYIPPY